MTVPALTLMRLKPLAEDGLVYKPFSAEDDFTVGWWGDGVQGEALYGYASVDEVTEQFYAIMDGQTEVARAQVEIEDGLNEAYPAPSVPGPYAVIHFFEVSAEHRRRGYGRQAIELLAARFRDAPLVAYSEDADEFWGSLGWERHEHGSEPEHYQPRYVADRR